MVSLNQIEKGVVGFLDNEVFPHLPQNGQFDEWKKLAAAAMAVYIVRRGRPALEKVLGNPFLAMIGATNNQNEVDIEGLREVFVEQMPEKGVALQIPLLPDITLYKSDIDKLYQYITGK